MVVHHQSQADTWQWSQSKLCLLTELTQEANAKTPILADWQCCKTFLEVACEIPYLTSKKPKGSAWKFLAAGVRKCGDFIKLDTWTQGEKSSYGIKKLCLFFSWKLDSVLLFLGLLFLSHLLKNHFRKILISFLWEI